MANYQYQTEFARRFIAEGKAEGLAEGEAKGEAKGKAEGVLAVLEARRIAVTKKQKQRILACTDLDLLGHWLRKAAVLTSVDELFAN